MHLPFLGEAVVAGLAEHEMVEQLDAEQLADLPQPVGEQTHSNQTVAKVTAAPPGPAR